MAAKKTAMWRIWLFADDTLAGAFEDALAPFGQSVTRFEEASDTAPGPRTWRITALTDQAPDRADISAALAEAAGRAGAAVPDILVEELEDVDWLALNRRQFPPLTVGRFFVHGRHYEGEAPQGKITIRLRNKEITVLEKGAILGEAALVCDLERSATAIAATDVKLWTISRDSFLCLTDEGCLLIEGDSAVYQRFMKLARTGKNLLSVRS